VLESSRKHVLARSVLLGMVVICSSCADEDPLDQRFAAEKELLSCTMEQVHGSVTHAQSRPEPAFEAIAKSAAHALNMLETYGEQAVTPVPDPYKILVARPSAEGPLNLVVYWLERDTDLCAVRVREYWAAGAVISETYPLSAALYADMRKVDAPYWMHTLVRIVTERPSPAVRMDSKLWDEYAKSESVAWQDQPPLYVAKPSDRVRVLVSLIDRVGHESRAVWLEVWLDPYRPGKPTSQPPAPQPDLSKPPP